MIRRLFLFTLLFISLSADAQNQFIGKWRGKINVQGVSLTLIFDIKESSLNNKRGIYSSELSVPQQGARNIPMSSTQIKKNKISIKSNVLGLEYQGKLEKNVLIRGEFEQNGQTFLLVLTKANEIQEELRQKPKPPFPYRSRNVQFSHGNGFIRFFGTYSYPKVDAYNSTTPVVILISGSGSQDRDETILGHKPFLIISDYLNRQNLAVLRVDDRGAGETKTKPSELKYTTADRITDVQSYIQFVRDSIGSKHPIYLLGHSEGARIAAEVAVKDTQVKRIIALGPALVNGAIINKYQNTNGLKKILRDSEYINAYLTLHDSIIGNSTELLSGRIKPSQIDSSIVNQLNQWKKHTPKNQSKKVKKRFEEVIKTDFDTYILHQYSQLLSNHWMLFFLQDDPIKWWTEIQQPCLLINGELDRQTPVELNKPVFDKYLSNKKNITYNTIDGINHIGQKAHTGHPSEYTEITTTVDSSVLGLIGTFFLED